MNNIRKDQSALWMPEYKISPISYSRGNLVALMHQVSLDHLFFHIFQVPLLLLFFQGHLADLVFQVHHKDQHHISSYLHSLYRHKGSRALDQINNASSQSDYDLCFYLKDGHG